MALHDRFKDYTRKEIMDIKRERCMKCPWSFRICDNSTKLHAAACGYLYFSGHMRGCMPDECEHYKDNKEAVNEIRKESVEYSIAKGFAPNRENGTSD